MARGETVTLKGSIEETLWRKEGRILKRFKIVTKRTTKVQSILGKKEERDRRVNFPFLQQRNSEQEDTIITKKRIKDIKATS